MPFTPVHKSYSPYGAPLSSYLPPGNLNSMLLGRLDFPGSGVYANRSPLLNLGGYGYGSYGGSYGSAYGGPPYISSPSKKYSGLPLVHEHSNRHARVSRVPQFNHISLVTNPIKGVSPSSNNTTPPRRSSRKIAVFNTEDIDVTSPRRPSRDESAEVPIQTNFENENNKTEDEETSTATPGEISRNGQSFGTIRRGRTVIRIQTKQLKENPYLITEERRDKKPKKTTGEKLKEKWAIQSKKKKHSGYRRPSLTEIREQQAALQREIEERQATLLSQRDAILKSDDNDSDRNSSSERSNNNLTQSQEREENMFFSNPDKIPKRKSTKKFLIVRQCSNENLFLEPSLPMSPDLNHHPMALSRSNSNVSSFSIPEESQGENEEPIEGVAINVITAEVDDDGIDFWATPALKSHRSTMIVRSLFRPINAFEYPPVDPDVSINEEEENCDLEIENILKNKNPAENQREVQVLKELEDIFSKSQIVPDTCFPEEEEEKIGEESAFSNNKNQKTVKRGKKNEAGQPPSAKDEKTEKTKPSDIIAPKTPKSKPKPSDIVVPKEESPLNDKSNQSDRSQNTNDSPVKNTFPDKLNTTVDSPTTTTAPANISSPKATGPLKKFRDLNKGLSSEEATPTSSPNLPGKASVFKFDSSPSSSPTFPTLKNKLGKGDLFPKLKSKSESPQLTKPEFLLKKKEYPGKPLNETKQQFSPPWKKPVKKEDNLKLDNQAQNKTVESSKPQEPSKIEKATEPVANLEKAKEAEIVPDPPEVSSLEKTEKGEKELPNKIADGRKEEKVKDKIQKFLPKTDDKPEPVKKIIKKAAASPFTKAKSQEVENAGKVLKGKDHFSSGDVPKQIEEIAQSLDTASISPAERDTQPTAVIINENFADTIRASTSLPPSKEIDPVEKKEEINSTAIAPAEKKEEITPTAIATVEKKEETTSTAAAPIKKEAIKKEEETKPTGIENKNALGNKSNLITNKAANQTPKLPNEPEEKPKFPWMKSISKVATPPATPPPPGISSPKLNKKFGDIKKPQDLPKPTPLKDSSSVAAASSETPPDASASKVGVGIKSAKSGKNIFGLQNRAKSKEEKRKSLEISKTEDRTEKIVQLQTNAFVSTGEEENNISEDSGIEVMGKPSTSEQEEKVDETSESNRSRNNNNNNSNATVTQVSESFTIKSHVEIVEIVDTCHVTQDSNKSVPALTETSASSSSSSSASVLPNPIVQGIIRDSLNRCSSEGSSGSVDGDSPPLTPKSSERDGSSSTTSSSTLSAGTSGSRRMPSPPSEDSDEDQETIANRICPTKQRPKFRRYEVQDFQFLKVLGKGSFGKVLLAELKGTDCYFAVKCLKKDVVLEDDDVECTMIERKVLLMGSKHPYLCHLLCTFQTESHLFFVMEYLNGGDLMFHIQQTGRFAEERARFYGAEIVSGLKFLHKKGIIYRDLKLDNILLDFEGHIRIADFGMCKLQIYLDRTADTFCGTPDYMAPEIIKGLKYNQCVDWWAFGILLYEMLIGQSPFSGCDEDELFWSICNESVRYPRFLSRDAKRILEMLLEKDASKRLGTSGCPHGDVKEQPFFQPINWDRLERREMEPPFKPKLKHSLDVQYFDTAFTKENPRLTPVDKEILRSMDQTQFDGFSYTNPHTTD